MANIATPKTKSNSLVETYLLIFLNLKDSICMELVHLKQCQKSQVKTHNILWISVYQAKVLVSLAGKCNNSCLQSSLKDKRTKTKIKTVIRHRLTCQSIIKSQQSQQNKSKSHFLKPHRILEECILTIAKSRSTKSIGQLKRQDLSNETY